MTVASLDKDSVKSPQRSRLGLSLDGAVLHVMVKDSIADAPVYAMFPLDMSLGSTTRALEEIIYNNPVILSDFARVDVLLNSSEFVLVPDEVVSGGTEFCESVVSASLADTDQDNVTTVESAIEGSGCTLLVKYDRDLVDFVRRTFNNPRIAHPLSVLTRHYIDSAALGTAGKMYVNMHDDKLDIVVFTDRGLSLLNTFSFYDPMDAVYYIMAVRSELGIEQTTGELYLSGKVSLRESITPALRSYIGYVMPYVTPVSLIRAGAAAAEAPFDLTLLLLCE